MLAAFALAFCAIAPAASQPLSTITITVGSSAGGTYDVSAAARRGSAKAISRK